MKSDNSHWYDGRFFDLFIAPNQDRIFSHIKKIVLPGSTILDIGCGTGRMAFELADKCSKIVGVDSSSKNIGMARRKLAHRPNGGISFHHAEALEFLSSEGNRFDYATLSFVIHEMNKDKRVELLAALARAADEIIMVDYMVPRPGRLRTGFDELVEFVAGIGNYRDFRSFVNGKGLTGLVEKTGLVVRREIKGFNLSAQVIVASRARDDRPGEKDS